MAVTLDEASRIVDEALAVGRAEGFMPLTVAVLDPGGHLVALKREDGSGILRVEIATGKAWGALGMGINSRTIRDRLVDRPHFIAALTDAAKGRFIPVPGGVLIRDADGRIAGAVGISGDTSEKDEYAAVTAVEAAGLRPDPAEAAADWRQSKL
jgi:uncharacterized protein GlcG (DUF336 family)